MLAGTDQRAYRLLTVVLSLVALATAGHLAMAQRPSDQRLQFDIPAQSLETALEAFGLVTRLQILYETSMSEGRRSTGVRGFLSREAALQQLLAGTGLDFNYTGERAFTLVYARPVSTRSISDFYPFLGDLQTHILSVLCRNSETRPGAFRIVLQLRVRPDGHIENLALLDSSGILSRDAAIAEVLANLSVNGTPPADMPQPITMVLRSGAPNGTDECRPELQR